MKKRLKRIAPVQAGLVLGIIYALFSLLVVPFFALFGLIVSLAPTVATGFPGPAAGLGIGFAIAMTIAAPVMYGSMGFVTGALGALIYNLVARWVGGIELELE